MKSKTQAEKEQIRKERMEQRKAETLKEKEVRDAAIRATLSNDQTETFSSKKERRQAKKQNARAAEANAKCELHFERPTIKEKTERENDYTASAGESEEDECGLNSNGDADWVAAQREQANREERDRHATKLRVLQKEKEDREEAQREEAKLKRISRHDKGNVEGKDKTGQMINAY
ncbi:trichohyalin [Planoprotostelium fungivorum]|uniref:Trichohyalin n=1 Tax=Planoprotostelium fungivorum TaxID=1890364 RepID=A0A2P6NPE3_9EUKA|nr:trichohyalin [Planoprotostelium fungivorum]